MLEEKWDQNGHEKKKSSKRKRILFQSQEKGFRIDKASLTLPRSSGECCSPLVHQGGRDRLGRGPVTRAWSLPPPRGPWSDFGNSEFSIQHREPDSTVLAGPLARASRTGTHGAVGRMLAGAGGRPRGRAAGGRSGAAPPPLPPKPARRRGTVAVRVVAPPRGGDERAGEQQRPEPHGLGRGPGPAALQPVPRVSYFSGCFSLSWALKWGRR